MRKACASRRRSCAPASSSKARSANNAIAAGLHGIRPPTAIKTRGTARSYGRYFLLVPPADPRSLPAMSVSDRITFGAREEQESITECEVFCPKFNPEGLIPALAIDSATGQPLMLAWMNRETLAKTLRIGEVVYYSRSRKEEWHKGATSGHIQRLKEIRTDCDQDVLLLYVEQQGGGACHTGRRSCFYRSVVPGDPAALKFVDEKRTFDPDEVYGKK